MRRLMMAGVLVLALPGTARAEDQPHRPWGNRAVIAMPFLDAQACIVRQMGNTGRVTIIPASGGSDIDWSIGGSLLMPNTGAAQVTFQLRDAADGVTLEILYRHPLSRKAMDRTVRDLGKRCLRVASVAPSAPAP